MAVFSISIVVISVLLVLLGYLPIWLAVILGIATIIGGAYVANKYAAELETLKQIQYYLLPVIAGLAEHLILRNYIGELLSGLIALAIGIGGYWLMVLPTCRKDPKLLLCWTKTVACVIAFYVGAGLVNDFVPKSPWALLYYAAFWLALFVCIRKFWKDYDDARCEEIVSKRPG